MTEPLIRLGADRDPEFKHDWPWVYFDREVEHHVDVCWNDTLPIQHATELLAWDPARLIGDRDWCPPDLVRGDRDLDEVPPGCYKVDVYGREAFLLLWVRARRGHKTGLVFFLSDTLAMRGALELCAEQSHA